MEKSKHRQVKKKGENKVFSVMRRNVFETRKTTRESDRATAESEKAGVWKQRKKRGSRREQ